MPKLLKKDKNLYHNKRNVKSNTREKSFAEVICGLESLDKGHAQRFLLLSDELAYTQ